MTPTPDRDLEREIARSLVAALELALTAGGTPAELRVARDAAQLLELPGLDRLIAALAPHALHPWPLEITPVVERLQRVCARAATAEGLAGFRRSDADFHGLADEIVAMEWGAPPARGGVSVATIGAAEMLSDLVLADGTSDAVARRVRLTMPVAAAVRAALDWLAGREGLRRPLVLREDASALEIVCELRDVAGVPPAHEVLAGVDGNLGPPLAASGEAREGLWILRVPAFTQRPSYVMLEQGSLPIAVPWHAVLKLLVAPREATATRAARLGMNVLAPLAPLAGRGSECPVVIVAHGLKRAWMVADRLVWRLPAETCEPDERMQQAGLAGAVRTEDGEVFGLVEPRRLLAAAPLPPLPRDVRPAPAPEARTQAGRPSESRFEAPGAQPAIEILDARWVRPLPAPAAVPAPAVVAPASAAVPAPAAGRARAAPAPAVAPTAAKAPARAGGRAAPAPIPAHERREAQVRRRALVAEDSITVRIFFTRLLEREGFEVVAVERAADLEAALASGPWSLACIDIELPDALGADLLRGVRARLPEETPLVALVRDDHDVTVARAAGVWRTLQKPVEPEALRRLLARLGLVERQPR